MKQEDLQRMLTEIEVSLARIDVHLQDIKSDVKDTKVKIEDTEKRVESLENFKSKTIGAVSIIIPLVAFIAAIGHDIIKRFMGWS